MSNTVPDAPPPEHHKLIPHEHYHVDTLGHIAERLCTCLLKSPQNRYVCAVCVRRADIAARSQVDAQLQSDIDKFWFAVRNSWDIEPREYFEKEARTNGFDSPLAMAVHYMWKREVKATSTPADEVERAWQSMESAPKDATWILGATQAGRQVVVRWGGGAWEDDNRLCRDPVAWKPLSPIPQAVREWRAKEKSK